MILRFQGILLRIIRRAAIIYILSKFVMNLNAHIIVYWIVGCFLQVKALSWTEKAIELDSAYSILKLF